MTTPLAPDVPSLDTFGGSFVDAGQIVDPTTDFGAADLNRMIAQLTMLSHTTPRAWVRVTCVVGALQTVADHDAVWGGTDAVKPTVLRSATGTYTVTWAGTYFDLQSTPESHSVNIRSASSSNVSSVADCLSCSEGITGPAQVAVKFQDSTGTAQNPTEFTVWIW